VLTALNYLTNDNTTEIACNRFNTVNFQASHTELLGQCI
jgi:hypothetical protein